MKTLVLVPTYNERDNLPVLVADILAVPGTEVMVLDDQSPDGTGAVADALARVGLTRQADRLFRTYSSGMRQRLSMGRALIADPVLLLLDEASTGLDPGRRESFKPLCLQLAKEQGKAILIASHDMAELEALCDTVHLLDGGRVVASGGFAAVAAAADAVFEREQAEEEA